MTKSVGHKHPFTRISSLLFKGIVASATLGITCFACAEESSLGPRTQFKSYEIWPDNNGAPINAHGGGVLLHDGVYYWYGEELQS